MIGETVGSYRILSKLGEGGMGVVYLAEHPLIGRKAAVKMILPDMSRSEALVRRFFTEARAAAAIRHPGLVDVFDFGQHENGSAYLVMEYLEGESLSDRMKRGSLKPEAIVAIVRQVAGAVGAAHAKGIVHRDLKPENLFLVSDPEAPLAVRVKVLDFGLAKLASEDGPGSVKTRTGAIFGTPQYMSPEQCRGAGVVDHRADIYSLGCIFYELATGRLPFEHEGSGDLIASHIHEQPKRPREVAPAVSPVLETVIMKAMAKKVDERYQSMSELAQALEALWTAAKYGGPTSLMTPPLGTVLPSSTPAVAAARTLPVAAEMKPSQRPTTTQIRRRRAGPLAVVSLLVLGTAAGALFWLRRPQPAVEPTTTASTAPAPAPVAAPAPAPAPVAAPAPAPEVSLEIDSTPRGADVYRAVDGIKLGKTPYVHRVASVKGEASFIVKLAGHREETVSLPAEKDGSVKVRLRKAPRPKKPPPASGPTVLDPYEGN